MCVKILFLREGWLKIETIYAGIGHNLDSNPSWNLYINKKKYVFRHAINEHAK